MEEADNEMSIQMPKEMKHDMRYLAWAMMSYITSIVDRPILHTNINMSMHFILCYRMEKDENNCLMLYEDRPYDQYLFTRPYRLYQSADDAKAECNRFDQTMTQHIRKKLSESIETIDEYELNYYLSQMLDGRIETERLGDFGQGFKIYWDFSSAEKFDFIVTDEESKFDVTLKETSIRFIDKINEFMDKRDEMLSQLAAFIVFMISNNCVYCNLEPINLIFKFQRFKCNVDRIFTMTQPVVLELEAALTENLGERIKLFWYREGKVFEKLPNICGWEKKIGYYFDNNLLEMLCNAVISPETAKQLGKSLGQVFERDFAAISRFEFTQKLNDKKQVDELIIKFTPSKELLQIETGTDETAESQLYLRHVSARNVISSLI